MMLWETLGKKLKEKIERLRFVGHFSAEEALEKGMRLVSGRGEGVRFDLLVDESDGIIADVRFQAYGPIALIAAAEVASEMMLRKSYPQVSRLTADLLDRHVRDQKERPAFTLEYQPLLHRILAAMASAVEQCMDIPFEASHDTTPIEADLGEVSGGISGWEEFSKEKKMAIVEEVVDKEIRPYVELDAGGVKVVDLVGGREVLIAYEGSCTSCHSSTGSTLTAIQQILRARVHPTLFVTPNL